MEIKDQKIIDTLAETLGVNKENLSGVKLISAEEHAAETRKLVNISVNTYFKENFLKRIDAEMNKAAKLNGVHNHLLLMLSDLRQKCLTIKPESKEIGVLFELAEQLGAIGYAIFIATKVDLNPQIVARLQELEEAGIDSSKYMTEASNLSNIEWINFLSTITNDLYV